MRIGVLEGRGAKARFFPLFGIGVAIGKRQAGAFGVHRSRGGKPLFVIGFRNAKRRETNAAGLGINEHENVGRLHDVRVAPVMILRAPGAAARRRDVIVHGDAADFRLDHSARASKNGSFRGTSVNLNFANIPGESGAIHIR